MANYLDVGGDKGLTAFKRGLGLATTLILLDDNSAGAADAEFLANLDDVCQRAGGDVDAFLSESFGGTWPTTIDPQTGKYAQRIREASLQLAIGYAYDRRPEYTRSVSTEGPLLSAVYRKRGMAILDELKRGVQAIVENVPAKQSIVLGGIVTTGASPMVCGVGGDWNV